jgi:hypothetical protein
MMVSNGIYTEVITEKYHLAKENQKLQSKICELLYKIAYMEAEKQLKEK